MTSRSIRNSHCCCHYHLSCLCEGRHCSSITSRQSIRSCMHSLLFECFVVARVCLYTMVVNAMCLHRFVLTRRVWSACSFAMQRRMLIATAPIQIERCTLTQRTRHINSHNTTRRGCDTNCQTVQLHSLLRSLCCSGRKKQRRTDRRNASVNRNNIDTVYTY